MLISENYQKKLWTNHERKAAQVRAFTENYEYILPIRLDDTEIPGILPTIGYLNWREETVNSIADILVLKVNPELVNKLEDLNEKLTYHFRHVAGAERGMHRWFMSTALTIKNLLLERQEATQVAYDISNSRRVYYLSPEFLLGRRLGQAIQYLAMPMHNLVKVALQQQDINLDKLFDEEPEYSLGDTSLGSLASCVMDSCATLQLPVMGYGLLYEHGMFTQTIVNGEQVEKPDHWLSKGHVWELERPELAQRIRFGGHTYIRNDSDQVNHVCWDNRITVLAVPYDIPVPGYQNGTVNTLRLWKATATDEYDLGDMTPDQFIYSECLMSKNEVEHITLAPLSK